MGVGRYENMVGQTVSEQKISMVAISLEENPKNKAL